MNKVESRSALFCDRCESSLGNIYLIFSGRFLTGVSFNKPSGLSQKRNSVSQGLARELARYFRGRNMRFSQNIKFLSGTDFEKKVWSALKDIPYGETRSYKWLAERIGRPTAVRAVGQALSKNPIPIVVPCHRVIESDGSIGGYSSGIKIKRRLLDLEYYANMGE